MPDQKKPVESEVPATEWDKTPMEYSEVPPTDEDGNPLPAKNTKRGGAADHEEKK